MRSGEGKRASQLRRAIPLPHHRAHPNSLRVLGSAGHMYATRRRTYEHESLLQALPSMTGTARGVAEAPVSLCA